MLLLLPTTNLCHFQIEVNTISTLYLHTLCSEYDHVFPLYKVIPRIPIFFRINSCALPMHDCFPFQYPWLPLQHSHLCMLLPYNCCKWTSATQIHHPISTSLNLNIYFPFSDTVIFFFIGNTSIYSPKTSLSGKSLIPQDLVSSSKTSSSLRAFMMLLPDQELDEGRKRQCSESMNNLYITEKAQDW